MNVQWRYGDATSGPAPLVVLFHGRGADEHDLLDFADTFPREYTVALPRGPIALDGGGYTWFENKSMGRALGPSLRASADAMFAWLAQLDPLKFDVTRVIAGGFSAGMLFATALMLDRPAHFCAGILLSGTAPWEVDEFVPAKQLAGKPVFHAHGDRDGVIPADLVALTERWLLEESGAVVDQHRYPMAHEIVAEEVRDLLKWFATRVSC
jgi:phospholipase/carboxylesterase